MTIYFELEGVLTKKQKEPEWMPGSQLIYDRLVSFAERFGWKVKILAKYYSEIDKKNKTRWIKENLKLTNKSIRLVSDQEYKNTYADPLSLLIDDSQERINSFIYSGGMGILYDGLASTVKKVEYFLEAMELLCKDMPDKVNDASQIIKARLACLFMKLGLNNWKSEYSFCLYYSYRYGCEYFYNLQGNFEDLVFDEDFEFEELPDAFHTLVGLFFELEPFAKKIEKKRKSEKKKDENDECKWHEKLMDYYFDKSNPLFTIFMDKTIFDKAWRHIEYVHKLKDFYHLHERQAVSVLMFVYINLLLEFIQKELAAEAAS